MATVTLAGAEAPLILALDLGTSSLRALVFDRHTRAIVDSEVQLSHHLRVTADGGAEADADALFACLGECLDGVLARLGGRGRDLAAVGTSCFWHSLVGVDAAGDAVTPLFMWADTRSAAHARWLRDELDPRDIQTTTGCMLHSSFWPAKLRWFGETRPTEFARARSWWSLAEYVARRLHGEARVSFSMASGTGLLDVPGLVWHDQIIQAAGISTANLPLLVDRDQPWPGLVEPFRARWPALASIPWFPAIGDGAAANVGSGAITPRRLALTLGTSGAMRLIQPLAAGGRLTLPPRVWAYRLDRNRVVLGGALSNGGNLTAWLRALLGVDEDDAVVAAAEAMAPDDHGLTLLPAVAGERSPSWDDRATGVIVGLKLATQPAHLLRAAMEAIAYRFAALYDLLRPLLPVDHEIAVTGGAILHSPAWLQLVADTLGHDLLALPPEDEASARRRRDPHLAGARRHPGLDLPPRPAESQSVFRPDSNRHARYRAGVARQQRLETLLANW